MPISEKTHKRIMTAWVLMKFLSVTSQSFWIADLLNSTGMKNIDEKKIGGVSIWSILLGFAIGGYSIAGFIASHHALFQLQSEANSLENSPDMTTINPIEENANDSIAALADDETTPLASSGKNSPDPEICLTPVNFAALIGSGVSCAVDVAAPLALVLRMLTENSDDFATRNQAPIEWALLVFGLSAQWAETRACKNAILKKKNPEDFWVKLTALGEFSGIFADLYFFARICSLIAWQSGVDSTKNNVLGLNQWMIIPAAVLCLFSAIGETICHMHINQHDESQNNPTIEGRTKLSAREKTYLFGDGLAQTVEFASTLGNVLHLIMGRVGTPLTKENELWVFIAAFLLGIPYALPDVLKSQHALERSKPNAESHDLSLWSRMGNCFKSCRRDSLIPDASPA